MSGASIEFLLQTTSPEAARARSTPAQATSPGPSFNEHLRDAEDRRRESPAVESSAPEAPSARDVDQTAEAESAHDKQDQEHTDTRVDEASGSSQQDGEDQEVSSSEEERPQGDDAATSGEETQSDEASQQAAAAAAQHRASTEEVSKALQDAVAGDDAKTQQLEGPANSADADAGEDQQRSAIQLPTEEQTTQDAAANRGERLADTEHRQTAAAETTVDTGDAARSGSVVLETAEDGNADPSTSPGQQSAGPTDQRGDRQQGQQQQARVEASQSGDDAQLVAAQQAATADPEAGTAEVTLAEGTDAARARREQTRRTATDRPRQTMAAQMQSQFGDVVDSAEVTEENTHARQADADPQPRAGDAATARSEVTPEAPRVLQSRFAARGVGNSQASETTSGIDPVRFVNRVARALQAAQERGGGPLQLRLHPPELGSVRIQITVHEGALTAQLETETTTARAALLDNLPALRERLAEQEIRIERFEVDVRDEPGGRQNFERPEQQGGRADGDAQAESRDDPSALASNELAAERQTPHELSDTNLNVVI